MKYLLDTNTISYILKNTYPSIKNHMIKVRPDNIYVPIIAYAELEYRARNSGKYDEIMQKNNKLLNAFKVAYFTESAAREYGTIRYDLKNTGTLIGPNDLLIAAIAKAENMTLVTHNTKEFQRVPGLMIEDWAI